MGYDSKMKTIKKELGSRIKQIRIKQGLNQRKFGELFGVGVSAISAYEAGKSVPPPETLMKIAGYGNVTVDYLFSGSEVGRSALLPEVIGIPVLSGDGKNAMYMGYLSEEQKRGVPDGPRQDSSSAEKASLVPVRHRDAVLELTKEEFTLISLFKKLSSKAQKEKLIELAYLTALNSSEGNGCC